jgi:hypothetical protein
VHAAFIDMSRIQAIDGDIIACDNPRCSKSEFVDVVELPAGWQRGAGHDTELTDDYEFDACSSNCRETVNAMNSRRGIAIQWRHA